MAEPAPFQPAGIASPCIGICDYVEALGFCTGCGRTLDDIGGWPGADDAARLRIRVAAAKRLGAERSAL